MKTVITLFATMLMTGAFASAAAQRPPQIVEPQLATPTNRPLKELAADKTATVLQSYTFDQGGVADAQGWVALDHTAGFRPYIHVDDHLPALRGSKSLWCGAIAGTDDPATHDWPTSGYGNSWHQSWVSQTFTTTSPDSTIFSCLIQWDLDDSPGSYDYIEVEYRIDSGSWVTGGFYANGSGAHTLRIPRLLAVGATIAYRFMFFSDQFNSNADGVFATPGAFLVDDLLVENGAGNILSSEDFESESIGATTTNSGDWHAESAPGFGLYANLFDGNTVRQDDPATFNNSHFWGFFEGSADLYNCNEPLAAVPTGGDTYPNLLSNEIQSPWIPLDLLTNPSSIRIDYDAYLDSPFEPGEYTPYHLIEVLCRDASGQFLESQFSPAYFGTFAAWIPMSNQFFIPAGTAAVQVVFHVIEILDSPCHRHAPLLDNVVISQSDAIIVTSLAGNGGGSLYWAIEQANLHPGLDVIEFDLPSSDWMVLDVALPPITEAVHIMGSTAAGSTPNTLTGANDAVIMARLVNNSPAAVPALDIQADDCVIEGLYFEGFNSGDIRIAGNNNVVQGCWLGSDPDGSYVPPIFAPRIQLVDAGSGMPDFTGNTIGGPDPASHNVIGNSLNSAIEANNQNSLTIFGNLLGLKPNGQSAASAKHGIKLSYCENVYIRNNVISGNTRDIYSHGIFIYRGGDYHIVGNIIGLSGSQSLAVPNSASGIEYQGIMGHTLIGGAYPDLGNIIAGNGGDGIRITEEGGVGIYFNTIGTNAAGYAAHLGNGGDGILMEYSLGVEVDIGESDFGNVIAHNDGSGIKVGEFMDDSFLILGNSIHDNAGPEIDFSLWSGTPLPVPVLTQASLDGLSLTVVGYLDGDPNAEYFVDLFANRYCADLSDPNAQEYIGSTFATADALGRAVFSSNLPGQVFPTDSITAIASRWLDYGSSAISSCLLSINTPQGTDVVVSLPVENEPTLPITATFDYVSIAGNTTVIYADDCDGAPVGYQVLGYYEVSTNAAYAQNVTFCFDYDEQNILTGSETGMMVLQGTDDPGNPFVDVTGSHDFANDNICGVISSLEPYPGHCLAIVAPLTASAVPGIPVAFRLLPNYPNPFNPSTTISFELPRAVDQVTVDVYDVAGRRVRRLHSGSAQSGRTELVWHGTDDAGRSVVSGVYLVQVVNGQQRLTQRVLLLK